VEEKVIGRRFTPLQFFVRNGMIAFDLRQKSICVQLHRCAGQIKLERGGVRRFAHGATVSGRQQTEGKETREA
jgi:hypothetical protein